MDTFFRPATIEFIRQKSEFTEAPTYSYQFTYEFPIDGGKAAWHCAEIPFVFHNIDRIAVCNVPGETDRLQERMATAWINFAATEARKPHPSRTGRHAPQGMKQP